MDADCFYCRKLQNPETASEVVWRFPHAVALLGPWQYYHGYCILVARTHATELSQLQPDLRRTFLDEMCTLAQAIELAFRPRKLNYEMLGNQVPHLHWHLFPRSTDDPEYLQPVWLALERAKTSLSEDQRLRTGQLVPAETIARLQEQLRKLGAVSID